MLLSASMGHTSTQATTQKDLTQNLIDSNILKTPSVIKVFEQVDRKYFCEPCKTVS